MPPARSTTSRPNSGPEEALDSLSPEELAAASARGKDGTVGADAAPPAPPAALRDASTPGSPARKLAEQQAARIEDRGWGGLMYGCLAPLLGSDVEVYSFKLLLDGFLAQLGPTGPVEKLLAEQMLLAHHLTGHLSVRAMNAQNPDAAKIFLMGAAKLMGEFRQSAVTLNSLRAPNTPSTSNTVKPGEAKPVGGRSDRPGKASGPPTAHARTELTTNRIAGYFPDAFVEQCA